ETRVNTKANIGTVKKTGIASLKNLAAQGFTYECKRCAPGTSQPSGAALQCEKCNPGEYQNEVGKQTCNRCEIGYYQDEPGSPRCVLCPSGTTLGLGSVSLADCGCEAGFIDQADDGNLSCLPCGSGLDCPALGSVTSLGSGSSPLGINFVPKVKEVWDVCATITRQGRSRVIRAMEDNIGNTCSMLQALFHMPCVKAVLDSGKRTCGPEECAWCLLRQTLQARDRGGADSAVHGGELFGLVALVEHVNGNTGEARSVQGKVGASAEMPAGLLPQGLPTLFYIDSFFALLASLLNKHVSYNAAGFDVRARYWAVGTASPGSGKSTALDPMKEALLEVLWEDPGARCEVANFLEQGSEQWSLLLTWWAASEEKCSIGLAGRFVFSFAGGGEPGPPATAQFGQQIALPILKRLFRIVLRTLGPHSPLPTDSPLLSWSADAEGLQAVYELRLLCSDLTKTLDMDETFASCINKSGYWLTTIAFWTSILRQVWPCAAAGRVDAVIHAQSQRDSLKLVMEFFTFRFFGKVQQCLLQMCVVALGSGSSHPASPKRTSGGPMFRGLAASPGTSTRAAAAAAYAEALEYLRVRAFGVLQPDFYSSPEHPLMLFRCLGAGRCPGGRPGSCAGGLQYRACTDCPEGQVFSVGSCQNCTVWQQAGWVLGLVLIFLGLVVAYYMLTLQSTAKASVLFTTACAFGLTISSLQSVGIVGMMTVNFPAELRPIFDLLQVFVLDIDSLAFSCIAGNSAPARYTSSVLFFPAMVLWLVVCSFASRGLSAELRWERSKTCSVIGALLQVGFSTMSSISMAPLMCFSHPNGVHSLLKYPSITCGTADHAIMLAMGLLLLIVGVLGFLALCTYAVLLSPRWSAQGQHTKVRAFRFLLFRFRLDSWWFGVPLLIRGPLLSLPIALATDYPPIQVTAMSSIFIVFLALECRAWPWKVPLLNVMDALLCLIMTLLVGSTSLHLGPIEGEMKDFASILASVLMGCLGVAMAALLSMTVAALVYRAALGGQQELFFFNLRKQPSSEEVSERLKASAARIRSMEESDLLQAVGLLSVYDLGLVVSYMSMAHSEIAATEAGDELQMLRICSHSFAPPKPKLRKMKKPSDLGRRLRLTVQRLTAEMDTGRPSLLQDEMSASFSGPVEAVADTAALKDVDTNSKEPECLG
ncbi:unnamed protein product, partial [Symbiodinium microadriaticum]